MMNKTKVLKTLKVVIVVGILLTAIGFVEKKQREKECGRIVVDIDHSYDNYFVGESDVLSLMVEGKNQVLIGTNYADLDLKKIENRIKTNKFVRSAEVFRDLKGNLKVEVKQCRPIARILQNDGPDAYISDEGNVLPVSERFTSRVVLVTGEETKNLVEKELKKSENGNGLFQLLKYIDEDEFWKAQIVEVNINTKGDIILYTQISKQYVEFGKAEELEEKFKKLKIFYKQILPQRGWNKYERVNLKYHNQIVCE
jgi:cell division protein FtsQ